MEGSHRGCEPSCCHAQELCYAKTQTWTVLTNTLVYKRFFVLSSSSVVRLQLVNILLCALCLQPEGSFGLTVTWTPTEEGGLRELIIFNANGVLKHQAVLLGRAEAPKKKKVNTLSQHRFD